MRTGPGSQSYSTSSSSKPWSSVIVRPHLPRPHFPSAHSKAITLCPSPHTPGRAAKLSRTVPSGEREDHLLLQVFAGDFRVRSEEHTSELQSRLHLVCRLLLEKKKIIDRRHRTVPAAQ